MKLFAGLAVLAACGAPDYAAPSRASLDDSWPYLSAGQIAGRAPYARPIDSFELADQLDDLFGADDPVARGDDPAALRRNIIDALNLGFMLERLRAAPPAVEVVATEDRGDFTWSRVVVRDPLVRDLELEYLVPTAGAGALPAVVGLHGHYDDGETFADDYLGTELAGRGYVVFAPTFRHMHCGDDERDQSVFLLREGFSLMTFRVYEALLAIELARTNPRVDPDRIGLLGHSGGSSTANLVVRLSDQVAAIITDYEVEYRDACGGQVHCETVPSLFPHAADINRHETLSVPHMRVPYGFSADATRAEMLAFFERAIGDG